MVNLDIKTKIYPNPTKELIFITHPISNSFKVFISDLTGKVLLQKQYYNTNTNFSERILFEKASAGLYLLKVTNGNKQTTRKLIIR